MREISRLEPAPQPLQIIDAETARQMMPTRCFVVDFEWGEPVSSTLAKKSKVKASKEETSLYKLAGIINPFD